MTDDKDIEIEEGEINVLPSGNVVISAPTVIWFAEAHIPDGSGGDV